MITIVGIGLMAFFLFIMQRKIYIKMWNQHLYVSIEFKQTKLFEGEKGELLEVIENRKRLPLSMLGVKFQTSRYLAFTDKEGSNTTDQYYRYDVFQIRSREKVSRRLAFIAAKRGYYKINNIDLISSDLFLTIEMVESRKTTRYIYVYPKPYNSEEFRISLKQQSGEVITKRHLVEDPFEYRGLREYQPFDDMRSVNWKATAKTDELMVNQKGYTSLKTIRIFLNIEDNGILKKEESVETSLQIVAGIAQFYLMQGIRVACYGNSRDIINGDPIQVEASAGTEQMDRIYKSLARTDTGCTALPFIETCKQKVLQEAKGTMTFFVSPNIYNDFAELMGEYQAAGHDYICFLSMERNEEPELPEVIKDRIQCVYPDF